MSFRTVLLAKRVLGERKKLKGTGLFISESLTKARLDILNATKDKVGNRNVWTVDGRIIAKIGSTTKRFTNVDDTIALPDSFHPVC